MTVKKKPSLLKANDEWLIALGKHIERLIKARGFDSIYDFYMECAGEKFSRAELHNIIKGKRDLKATSVRSLAKLLGVKPSIIIDFDFSK